MVNAATGDVMTVAGAVTGGSGALNLEVDLSNAVGGTSGNGDRIVATGGASGTVNLNLTTIATGALQATPTVLATNGAGATYNVTGLPAVGSVLYTLENQGGNAVIQSQVNPAVGGVSGSVNLVQSLIGTVVNRPSSPFVGGLYSQDGGDCGYGAWGRVVGGSLDADGRTTNQTTSASTVNATDMNYGGLQVGGDWGCFNGSVSGWDIAVGGFLGLNTGSATQTISLAGSLPTETDFDQRYAGVYLSGAKGAFSFDLQLRAEDTDYEITNATLGLAGAEINNQGLTFSGSANYAIPVNESGLTFIPTIGFGITENDTSTLTFGGGETLAFEDFQSQTGFIGATLANTTVSPNGLAATNVFGTATAYTDFDRSRTSTFTSGAVAQQLITDGLGSFGEVSVGVNHVRILDGSGSSNARQLSASVRADYRFNSDIESFGLTAQLRLQF